MEIDPRLQLNTLQPGRVIYDYEDYYGNYLKVEIFNADDVKVSRVHAGEDVYWGKKVTAWEEVETIIESFFSHIHETLYD